LFVVFGFALLYVRLRLHVVFTLILLVDVAFGPVVRLRCTLRLHALRCTHVSFTAPYRLFVVAVTLRHTRYTLLLPRCFTLRLFTVALRCYVGCVATVYRTFVVTVTFTVATFVLRILRLRLVADTGYVCLRWLRCFVVCCGLVVVTLRGCCCYTYTFTLRCCLRSLRWLRLLHATLTRLVALRLRCVTRVTFTHSHVLRCVVYARVTFVVVIYVVVAVRSFIRLHTYVTFGYVVGCCRWFRLRSFVTGLRSRCCYIHVVALRLRLVTFARWFTLLIAFRSRSHVYYHGCYGYVLIFPTFTLVTFTRVTFGYVVAFYVTLLLLRLRLRLDCAFTHGCYTPHTLRLDCVGTHVVTRLRVVLFYRLFTLWLIFVVCRLRLLRLRCCRVCYVYV